ncbi:hypothetical protein GP2_075_00040 [Gordonia paraffinivorans NBRC 108238]|uniref:Uncharacterized protein n=1 Tax=Gordonia paraffinivorans NBRC 108238 TaxID=1223543 RepID=A0ABQ0IRW2_9ACTN|nr:hypothetical protein GP2_075_00040 [Gordonia paraffinivorans NBRC 108238]
MARHTYDNLVDCKTSTFSTARPSHMVHRAECCSDNGGGIIRRSCVNEWCRFNGTGDLAPFMASTRGVRVEAMNPT